MRFAPKVCGGSSPLTRGKRSHWTAQTKRSGLIPAHAGKTERSHVCRARGWAHPRSRGENQVAEILTGHSSGSSPLTRGKRAARRRGRDLERLIPAHAGKTWPRGRRGPTQRAHPRSRGENTADDALTAQPAGSSPLTRGKQLVRAQRPDAAGLIPAHAGKTTSTTRSGTNPAAHPRSRGENGERAAFNGDREGSSPLTRGKRPSSPSLWDPLRLIPAHAGKTIRPWGRWPAPAAHPRSRGENHDLDYTVPGGMGSSPLTRGKLGA